jgi:hypothetical protein
VSAAAATCLPCPSGTWNGLVGASSCASGSACPLGFYGPLGAQWSGTTRCLQCVGGTFSNTTGLGVCLGAPCPPGSVGPWASTNRTAATCALCPAGWFSGTPGAQNCTRCPAGTHSSSPGASSCTGTICPAGFFAPDTQTQPTTCQRCPRGTTARFPGSTNCSVSSCPLGTYGPACDLCPSGTWANTTGLDACDGTPCPLGQFGPVGSTNPRAATCSPCGSGSYADAEGTGPACLSNFSTVLPVLGTVLGCVKGSFGPLGSTSWQAATCSLCTPGTFSMRNGAGTCEGGSVCTPGTFGVAGASFLAQSRCKTCPSGTWSSGTGASNCTGTMCSPGFFGPLGSNTSAAATCSACPPGLFTGPAGGQDGCYLGSICPAGFQGSVGGVRSSPCSKCAPGTYTTSPGSTTCVGTPCSPGTAGPSGATSAALAVCSPCPSGSWTSVSGQETCSGGRICLAGQYGPLGATMPSETGCFDCPSGTHSASGASNCTGVPCSPGTWGPTRVMTLYAQNATCTPCGGGLYSSTFGAGNCSGVPCPHGTYSPVTGATTASAAYVCLSCEPGQWAGPGASSCTGSLCGPGYFGMRGATNPYDGRCVPCGSGKWSTAVGATSCAGGTACPAGQYGVANSTSAATATCVPCPARTYSTVAGSETCIGTPCPAGYFSTDTTGRSSAAAIASHTCTPCPGGQYSTTPGSATCAGTPCAVGRASLKPAATSAAEAACASCRSGQYTTTTGSTSCLGTMCGLGFAGSWGSSSAGAATCGACMPGTYSDVNGSQSCTGSYCNYGSYGVSGAKSAAEGACTLCPSGMYQPNSGSTSCLGTRCTATNGAPLGQGAQQTCVACQNGQWSSAGTPCQGSPCAAGFYGFKGTSEAQQKCFACPSGTYTTTTGSGTSSSVCQGTQCPAGKWGPVGSNSSASAVCYDCPPGTSNPWTTGAGSCTPCGWGTYAAGTGSTSCTDCGIGNYSLQGATSCLVCPPGTYQSNPTSGACSTASGYGFPNWGTGDPAPFSCGPGTYAPAGSTACLQCAPGTFNPYSRSASCQVASLNRFVSGFGATAQVACADTMRQSQGPTTCVTAWHVATVAGTGVRDPLTGRSYFIAVWSNGLSGLYTVSEGLHSAFTLIRTYFIPGETNVRTQAIFPSLGITVLGMSASSLGGSLVIVAIPQNSNTIVGSALVLPAAERDVIVSAADVQGGFVYAGTSTGSPSIVQVAVTATTLVRVSAVNMSTLGIASGTQWVAAAVDPSAGIAYFVGSAPGLATTIVRVFFATAAARGIASSSLPLLSLPRSDGQAEAAFADSDYLYVACSSGALVRISARTFRRVGSVALVDASGTADGPVGQGASLGNAALLGGFFGAFELDPANTPLPYNLVLAHSTRVNSFGRITLLLSNATHFLRVYAHNYAANLAWGAMVLTNISATQPAIVMASNNGGANSNTDFGIMPLGGCALGFQEQPYGNCAPCPAGTWASSVGVCSACPRGTISTTESALSCSSCAVGQTSNVGSSSCYSCTTLAVANAAVVNLGGGRYRYTCNAGYQLSPLNFAIATCHLNGTYSNLPTCVSCGPLGGYSVAGDANCTSCPAGSRSTSPFTSLATCVTCAKGQYTPRGSPACLDCPLSTYGLVGGISSCTSCPAGYSTDATGATDASACNICAAGSFAAGPGFGCVKCPRGFYSFVPGSTSCTRCQAGTTTRSTGASACFEPDSATLTIAPGTPTWNLSYTALAFDPLNSVAFSGLSDGRVVAVGYMDGAKATFAASRSGFGFVSSLAVYAGSILLVADSATGSLRATLSMGPASGAVAQLVTNAFSARNATNDGSLGLAAVAVDPSASFSASAASVSTAYLLVSSAAESGSSLHTVGGLSALPPFFAGTAALPAGTITVTPLGTTVAGNPIGDAPASLAVDLSNPSGPLLLVGNAHGRVIAVPAGGPVSSAALWLDTLYDEPVTELLIDPFTRVLTVVLGGSGNAFLFRLDDRAFVGSLQAPANFLPLAAVASDGTSGQLLVLNGNTGTVAVGFRCSLATAGSGFLQPCSTSPCPAGSASTVDGGCSPCAPGTFSSAPGSTVCESCPIGSFAGNGSTSCSLCPAGTSTHASLLLSTDVFYPLTAMGGMPGAVAASQCVVCPIGTASPSAGSPCAACGLGSVAVATASTPVTSPFAFPGALFCASCPAGWSTLPANPTVCVQCPPNTYKFDTAPGPCRACPTTNLFPWSPPGSSVCPGSQVDPRATAIASDPVGRYAFFGHPNNYVAARTIRTEWGSTVSVSTDNRPSAVGNIGNHRIVAGAIHQPTRQFIASYLGSRPIFGALDIETLAVRSELVLNATEYPSFTLLLSAPFPSPAALTDPYVYAVSRTWIIVKLFAANLTVAATQNITASLPSMPASSPVAGAIDADATFAYIASASTTAHFKIRLSDLAVVATGAFASTRTAAVSAFVDPYRAAIVYVHNLCPVHVVWVSTATLAETGNLTFPDLCGALPTVFTGLNGPVGRDGATWIAGMAQTGSNTGFSAAVVPMNVSTRAVAGPVIGSLAVISEPSNWMDPSGGVSSAVIDSSAAAIMMGVQLSSRTSIICVPLRGGALQLTDYANPLRGSNWSPIVASPSLYVQQTTSPFNAFMISDARSIIRSTQLSTSRRQLTYNGAGSLTSGVDYSELQMCVLETLNAAVICINHADGVLYKFTYAGTGAPVRAASAQYAALNANGDNMPADVMIPDPTRGTVLVFFWDSAFGVGKFRIFSSNTLQLISQGDTALSQRVLTGFVTPSGTLNYGTAWVVDDPWYPFGKVAMVAANTPTSPPTPRELRVAWCGVDAGDVVSSAYDARGYAVYFAYTIATPVVIHVVIWDMTPQMNFVGGVRTAVTGRPPSTTAIQGTIVYLMTSTEITIIDISNVYNPFIVRTVNPVTIYGLDKTMVSGFPAPGYHIVVAPDFAGAAANSNAASSLSP